MTSSLAPPGDQRREVLKVPGAKRMSGESLCEDVCVWVLGWRGWEDNCVRHVCYWIKLSAFTLAWSSTSDRARAAPKDVCVCQHVHWSLCVSPVRLEVFLVCQSVRTTRSSSIYMMTTQLPRTDKFLMTISSSILTTFR